MKFIIVCISKNENFQFENVWKILEGFDKNSGRYVMRTRLSQNLSETSKTQGGAPEFFFFKTI